ncbi:MAG: Na(+)/H(+) antiporter subunit B [Nitrospirota bacterium]|jgi:multicomponent Na+:H+ antiporter subunit B
MNERPGVDIIRRTVSGVVIPFIQLFGFYVIVHGDSGPGGGFQGGVILGASVILYCLAFGLREARAHMARRTSDILDSAGVLIYAGVGLAALALGGAFLQYNVLPLGDPHFASHIGIFIIEVGVGITVSGVMITIFFATADRGSGEGGE